MQSAGPGVDRTQDGMNCPHAAAPIGIERDVSTAGRLLLRTAAPRFHAVVMETLACPATPATKTCRRGPRPVLALQSTLEPFAILSCNRPNCRGINPRFFLE